ncbi:hypothetical protein [Acinetobacter chinensis]|uniref:hypothetical protein n=2 Tax=Acinetobacter TaxID=469 RepID=UPI000B3D4103|nr:hypothetical protein [Acinetobacter chinensis]AXY59823.1 hypothetical protein CDG61_07150 [Acinetobacter sp. WCHAc010052]
MKAILSGCLLTAFSLNAVADSSYEQYKVQVRNQLVECLEDPENNKFSAAYNACLLKAADDFIGKADIEYKSAYKKANEYEKDNLIKNRKIYVNVFKACENFQNLSFDGFGNEAACKITVAKNYLGSLTNSAASLPDDWTIANRVDKYFIGY